MNIDRAAELIAWTIRGRCVRYGIAFIPVDGLDIDNLAAEIAANLRDPPVQFRPPGIYVCPAHAATGGYEACCNCGGWAEDDPDRGRKCSEAER
jgi:hypothetical protein